MSLTKLVAIVDDEPDITTLFHDALSRIEGISVVSFNDPTLALEHYKDNKQNYALIISDMRMPAMNGLELLQKVKRLNPQVKTILISAFAIQDNPDFDGYFKNGIVDSFIEKPISLNRLCQKVKEEIHSEHR